MFGLFENRDEIAEAKIFFGSTEATKEGMEERKSPYDDVVVSRAPQCDAEDTIKALKIAQNASKEAKKAVGKDNGGGNPQIKQTSKKSAKTYYKYHNENRETLYQVCRAGQGKNKKFWIQTPNNNGGWVNSGKGVRKILYNLPEIAEAETIFFVEGEKDVETLKELGYVATTSPHGAASWNGLVVKYQIDTPLHNKTIYILPDNDDPGEQYAQMVANILHGKAKEVKVLRLPNLPPEGDITDFLEQHAGFPRSEF